MPEGDTLWNHAAQLRPALVGNELAELRVHRSRTRGPRAGSTIDAVEARGKHLLITFSDGVILHTHLQMTGVWHLYRRGQRWTKTPGKMRAVVATADHEAVCFAAPTVSLYHPLETRERPWDRIGPDLCHDDVDLDLVLRNLDETGQERQAADVLLDQRLAAGIGNVYKTETLWACRVHPMTPLAEIDSELRHRLYTTASAQLRANLGRSKRRTYRNGLAIYGRGGRDCPRCHATIRSAEHGDDLPRISYWCERCQVLSASS